MKLYFFLMYLADKYPERRLAPAVGTPERGEYYQGSSSP